MFLALVIMSYSMIATCNVKDLPVPNLFFALYDNIDYKYAAICINRYTEVKKKKIDYNRILWLIIFL